MENTIVSVKVENFEEGTVYYWNTETFYNRYDMMKELFEKYQDDDIDIVNLKNDEDPLWDEPKPTILGYTFYKLEPLAYLMNNPTTSSIVSSNGHCLGSLVTDIIPVDDDGNIFEEIPEEPYELIGQPLNFKINIKEAKDLPENFSRDIQVEYTSFYDNIVHKTKVIAEKNKNPVFEEFFEHRIEYLTKDDIDLLIKEKLCFRIFAFEEVTKKGKIVVETRNSTNDFNFAKAVNMNQKAGNDINVNVNRNVFENIQSVPTKKAEPAHHPKTVVNSNPGLVKNGKNDGKEKKDKEKDGCIIY